MFTFSESRLTLPLNQNEMFISAYYGKLVFGKSLKNGLYHKYFVFEICDISTFYNSLLKVVKFFAGSTTLKELIQNKNETIYFLTSKQVNITEKFISFAIEENSTTTFEMLLSQADFNRFIEAISNVLWHCLCAKDDQLLKLKIISSLPVTNLLALKDTKKMQEFLKKNCNDCSENFTIIVLFEYHLDIIIMLHNLRSLINPQFMHEKITQLCNDSK